MNRRALQMNPSIFILEDNPAFSQNLVDMINHYPISLNCFVASDLNSALKKLDDSIHYTAFFVDIALDETTENKDGLAFAKYLSENSSYRETPVIFTTSFPHYIYEALNQLHCYAYLLKPFRQEDVFYQLDQILKTNCSIRLKTADGIFMKLNTNDIYFIQAFGRNMLYATKHGEICSRQYTMKSLTDILPEHFVRCHKSFIVNKKYIHSTNPKERTLHIKEIEDDIPYGKVFYFE